jgi:hypothetical protein
MATWIVKQKYDSKWARLAPISKANANVDGPLKIMWVDIARASSFATRELAMAAYSNALKDMNSAALDTAAKHNAGGGKPTTRNQSRDAGRWQEWDALCDKLTPAMTAEILSRTTIPDWARNYDDAQRVKAFAALPLPTRPNLPKWLADGTEVHYESVASHDDMLGSMNVYFVRAGSKWSAGPSHLVPEMHQARAYFSKEAALEVAAELSGFPDVALVQASMLITAVDYLPESKPIDELCKALHAACESREIQAAIESMGAVRAARSSAAHPKRRL